MLLRPNVLTLSLVAVLSCSVAVNAATLSLRAQGVPTRTDERNNDLYDRLFGSSGIFNLNFQFSSFAPVLQIGSSYSSYDLESVEVVAGNGFSFVVPTDGLGIGDSDAVGEEFSSLGFSRSEFLNYTFVDRYGPKDTEVIITNFEFRFLNAFPDVLTSPLGVLGFPDATLSAFEYLGNVPTPTDQRFSVFGVTRFLPDGTPIFDEMEFDIDLSNFEVVSKSPSPVPLPAGGVLLGTGLLALFVLRTRNAFTGFEHTVFAS
ncbi:MAG: hypothetical protein JWS10_3058 [Cypionkella sp.]|uniref:hypothetical protein n=1 Tax=Cypionkella sp. TaxID=2811411 RepID=UPI002637F525|nr:hypothetical protein [Cypionkella sp.]MDB5660443.1 hypothetical protein [Cypionkella sp.]